MKATAGAFMGSLALMLLSVNFAFDVLRRFDFESERGEVAREMEAARFFIDDAHMLWDQVEEQHSKTGRSRSSNCSLRCDLQPTRRFGPRPG